MKYEITAEMNLSNIIEEAREVSRALYEFADKLESIERKYKELRTESEGVKNETISRNPGL